MSDEAIYSAAVSVLASHGSSGLTLARVAAELGVTPAAVRQRFGSKRGLLLAIAQRRTLGTDEAFALARAASGSKLEALERALLTRIEGLREPTRLANAISAYVDNAADPELRELFASELAEMERNVAALLAEAAEGGEIAGSSTPRLAAGVFAAFEGALTVWAIAPRGRVEDRVHDALEVALGREFPKVD